MGNAKNFETVDVLLKEQEKEEKMHGMECGPSCVNVDSLEREIREL